MIGLVWDNNTIDLRASCLKLVFFLAMSVWYLPIKFSVILNLRVVLYDVPCTNCARDFASSSSLFSSNNILYSVSNIDARAFAIRDRLRSLELTTALTV